MDKPRWSGFITLCATVAMVHWINRVDMKRYGVKGTAYARWQAKKLPFFLYVTFLLFLFCPLDSPVFFIFHDASALLMCLYEDSTHSVGRPEYQGSNTTGCYNPPPPPTLLPPGPPSHANKQ